MSFSITFYGPRHYFWKEWRVWFYHKTEHSTGGTGFNIPFLHVVFMWGREWKK